MPSLEFGDTIKLRRTLDPDRLWYAPAKNVFIVQRQLSLRRMSYKFESGADLQGYIQYNGIFIRNLQTPQNTQISQSEIFIY